MADILWPLSFKIGITREEPLGITVGQAAALHKRGAMHLCESKRLILLHGLSRDPSHISKAADA
eukprot:4876221-Prorocentrum_lima.AAC.1